VFPNKVNLEEPQSSTDDSQYSNPNNDLPRPHIGFFVRRKLPWPWMSGFECCCCRRRLFGFALNGFKGFEKREIPLPVSRSCASPANPTSISTIGSSSMSDSPSSSLLDISVLPGLSSSSEEFWVWSRLVIVTVASPPSAFRPLRPFDNLPILFFVAELAGRPTFLVIICKYKIDNPSVWGFCSRER